MFIFFFSLVVLGTNFTLAELGICEPSPHRSGYCSDIGILHQGYSLSTGSDNDSDTEGGMSPEHAIRLWGRGIKSRRSSGLSSRENSALTLTDSDNENKSDEENGRVCLQCIPILLFLTYLKTRHSAFKDEVCTFSVWLKLVWVFLASLSGNYYMCIIW